MAMNSDSVEKPISTRNLLYREVGYALEERERPPLLSGSNRCKAIIKNFPITTAAGGAYPTGV